jgi:hypothetical protein
MPNGRRPRPRLPAVQIEFDGSLKPLANGGLQAAQIAHSVHPTTA